jgi:hypothetical protein
LSDQHGRTELASLAYLGLIPLHFRHLGNDLA